MSTIRMLLMMLCIAASSDHATSQVTVTYHAGASTVSQTFSTGLGVSIPVVVGNQHDYVEISCNPSTADLGEITVSSDVQPPPTNVVWILITKDDLLFGSDPAPGALSAANWAGLLDNRGNLRLRAGISGNLTDSILMQNSSHLVNLRVNGEIQAGYTGGAMSSTEIQAGSIASQGDITANVGRIHIVNVSSGNMRGDIKAVAGSIGTIDVTNGDIGASGQPVAIEAADESGNLHIKTDQRRQEHLRQR